MSVWVCTVCTVDCNADGAVTGHHLTVYCRGVGFGLKNEIRVEE